jgi:hypothetical protein
MELSISRAITYLNNLIRGESLFSRGASEVGRAIGHGTLVVTFLRNVSSDGARQQRV